MKKYIYFSIILTSSLFFVHCKNEQEVLPSTSKINFNEMKVGQESYYVRFETTSAWDTNPVYKQLKDTVRLKIVAKESEGFKIEEKRLNQDAPNTYYYFLKIVGDSLFYHRTTDYSSFFSVGDRFLLKTNNLPLLTTNQWATPINENADEIFGSISEVTFMGKTYKNPILYYNRKSIPWDGPEITKVYSKNDGFISFQSTAWRASLRYMYNLAP